MKGLSLSAAAEVPKADAPLSAREQAVLDLATEIRRTYTPWMGDGVASARAILARVVPPRCRIDLSECGDPEIASDLLLLPETGWRVIAAMFEIPPARVEVCLGRGGALRWANFTPLLAGLAQLNPQGGVLRLMLDEATFKGAELGLHATPPGWTVRTRWMADPRVVGPESKANVAQSVAPAKPRVRDDKGRQETAVKRPPAQQDQRTVKKARWDPPKVDSSSEEEDMLAVPRFVRVESQDGRALFPRALLAEMNANLAIAKRGDAVDGVYTGGLASCRAVILESHDAIGLAHTSHALEGDAQAFEDYIDACASEFQKHGKGEVRLRIGYSLQGLKDTYEMDGEHCGWRRFCETHDEESLRVAVERDFPEGTHEQWLAEAIQRMLRRNEERLVNWARRRKVELVKLPHAALLIPIDKSKPLCLFDSEPRDVRTR